MSSFAVFTLLLSITAFYVFLSIYILMYFISNHFLGFQTVKAWVRRQGLPRDDHSGR